MFGSILLDQAEVQVYGERSGSDDDWLDRLASELELSLAAIATNLTVKYGVRVVVNHG